MPLSAISIAWARGILLTWGSYICHSCVWGGDGGFSWNSWKHHVSAYRTKVFGYTCLVKIYKEYWKMPDMRSTISKFCAKVCDHWLFFFSAYTRLKSHIVPCSVLIFCYSITVCWFHALIAHLFRIIYQKRPCWWHNITDWIRINQLHLDQNIFLSAIQRLLVNRFRKEYRIFLQLVCSKLFNEGYPFAARASTLTN